MCVPMYAWALVEKDISKNCFFSTDISEKRLTVAKSRQELDELDDNSTDI